MRLTAAVLAEYAVVRDGLLHLFGGGINRLVKTSLPASIDAALVLIVSPDDAADMEAAHAIRVSIMENANKQPVAELELTWPGIVGPNILLSPMPSIPLVVPIQDIQLPSTGLYSFLISVNQQLSETLNFAVVNDAVSPSLTTEWEHLIESTSKQVADVPVKLPVADGTADGTGGQELRRIAEAVPAAAVLEAFARLERRLVDMTSDLETPHHGLRVQSVRAMATSAYKNGAISEIMLGVILNLGQLRNDAAHRVGAADISVDQAYEYLRLVDRVLEVMDLNARNALK